MKAAQAISSHERDWRAEEDMRTLARAEEIKRDPARLKAAQKKAREKLDELQAVASSAKPKR
jgi:hypothetical protein